MNDHSRAVQEEFGRAAEAFAARTAHRFDGLDVAGFSRLESGQRIVEIGAGTGNFLASFDGRTSLKVALDLTPAMLVVARRLHSSLVLVAADGSRLPLRDHSFDLVCSAQALHHIPRPVPVVAEMRRITAASGRLLIVDQVAPEHYEEAVAMNELEVLRDPTHAASRPPSAMRTIVRAAGLEIVDERFVEVQQRLSQWMWPEEYPPERIEAVRAFIHARGAETGLGFEPDGDDYTFTRTRMMLLAAGEG